MSLLRYRLEDDGNGDDNDVLVVPVYVCLFESEPDDDALLIVRLCMVTDCPSQSLRQRITKRRIG